MEHQSMMPLIISLVIFLAITFVVIISFYKLFEKAGKPGWAAIVPIYNFIVMLEIAKKPIWWIVLLIVPIVNFIILILVLISFLKAYGKEGIVDILLALFVGVIYFPMIAFSDSTKYVG